MTNFSAFRTAWLISLLALSVAVCPAAEPAAPVRCDLYGDPLPEGAIARLGTTRFRDPGGIHNVLFTPDGRLMLAASGDGIQVFDAATGKSLRRFYGKQGYYHQCNADLSPDGQLVALGGAGASAPGVYDIATGRRQWPMGEEDVTISAVRFSPDGKTVATLDRDDTITFFDTATGLKLRSWLSKADDNESSRIERGRFLAFGPEGKTLFSVGSHNNRLSIWDTSTGFENRRLTPKIDAIRWASMSKDGKTVAVQPYQRVVRRGEIEDWKAGNEVLVLNVDSGKETQRIKVPNERSLASGVNGPWTIAFTPDGKQLVTAGLAGVIRFWGIETGKQVSQFDFHTRYITGFGFPPDGKTLAFVNHHCIRRCDMTTGQELSSHPGHLDQIDLIRVSSDGKTIATGSRDGSIRIWDAQTSRQLRRIEGQYEFQSALLFDPTGRHVFTNGGELELRKWDVATGKRIFSCENPKSPYHPLDISPDGKLLAVRGFDFTMHLLDASTGKHLRVLSSAKDVALAMAFSADGKKLHTWQHGGNIKTWDTATAKLLRSLTLPFGNNQYTAAIAPNGRYAVCEEASYELKIVDLQSTILSHRVKCQAAYSEFAFSPDSRMLAWAGILDRQDYCKVGVGLIEVASGKERLSHLGFHGTPNALAFAPDASYFVTGSYDTSALIWPITEPARVLTAEERLMCLKDLMCDDAAQAFRSMQKLVADPKNTVPALRQHVAQATTLSAPEVDRLLVDLESEDFAIREKASTDLERCGDEMLATLRERSKSIKSPEAKRRLDDLFEQRKNYWSLPHHLREMRTLEILERMATHAARELIEHYAKGPADSRFTQEAKETLERIARREALAR